MPAPHKKYEPNDSDRRVATILAATGMPWDDIAAAIGTSRRTMERAYKTELKTAQGKVIAQVASKLVQTALNSPDARASVAACCFYLKCKGGWREKHDVDVNAKVSFVDIIKGAMADPSDD